MSSKLLSITKAVMKITWPWYLSGTICFTIAVWTTLLVPKLIQTFLDSYLAGDLPAKDLEKIALYIVVIGITIIIVRTASRTLILWTGRLTECYLRDHYYQKSLYFTRESIETYKVGDLVSRLSTDLRQIGFFYGFGIVQLLNFFLVGFFTVRHMLAIHVTLTALVYLPMILKIIMYRLITPKIFALSKVQQEKRAKLSEIIAESFHNIQSLHSEGCLDSFFTRIRSKNQDLYWANIWQASFRVGVMPLLSLMVAFSYLVVLYYGGHLVLDNQITIGELTAFNAYIAIQTVPLFGLALFIAIRERAKTTCLRLEQLDQLKTESPSTESHQHMIALPDQKKPLLELRHVSFRYVRGLTPTLSHLNLSINHHEHVGIMGKIGSGKSTLFKLMVRLYDWQEGQYFIAGMDISNHSPDEVRKYIGFVTQENHFFSESIAFNLSLGLDEQNSDELHRKMVEVTKIAMIYDEIIAFKDGFQTQIGQKGMRLSGGQKQRLSLAQALMHNKKIYLLDDIFSALDHGTEKQLIEQLARLPQTFILVSHRKSVLAFCDRVLELRDGTLHPVDEF
ncbi:MAG: ABC transporter ATP-binding protein [Proteobacteria bacterium]|nr:ABC transporter ATP-binding protein [Pseudomonadota bacterium]